MAAIFAYFSAINNGELDESYHIWFFIAAVAGSILVAGGILLESHWPISRMKVRERWGITLVILGVVIEASFTFALLTFDEGISRRQQETISRQQSRIADLDVKTSAAESDAGRAIERAAILSKESEELRSKNLALEAAIAPRDVSDDDVKEIIDGLTPFAGREISVKSYLGDTEGHRLLFVIVETLSHAGLHVIPGLENFDDSPKVMLLEGMEIDAPPQQRDLADALQGALSKTKLGIRPQWFVTDAGTTVLLKIGVKPFDLPKFQP